MSAGEAQSDGKDPVLQVGIYTVGELRKTEASKSLACVAMNKSKSAHILMVKLFRNMWNGYAYSC